jgi:hypothetical protein
MGYSLKCQKLLEISEEGTKIKTRNSGINLEQQNIYAIHHSS